MNFLPVVLSGTGGNAIFILIAYVVVFGNFNVFPFCTSSEETSEIHGCHDCKP